MASSTASKVLALVGLSLFLAPFAQAEIHPTGRPSTSSISYQERNTGVQTLGSPHMTIQDRGQGTTSSSSTCETCTYTAR